MVYRVFVEKKKGLAHEARSLQEDIRSLLHIQSLTELRVVNRYDVENISPALFDYAVKTVLSEPQLDLVSSELDARGMTAFAVEYLPGSSTSGQTPPPSVSRSSPRASARRSALPEYIFSEARLRKKSLRR